MAEYIPLPDLPGFEDVEPADLVNRTLPPVVWSVSLPPNVDAERIVLDQSALKRYHRVGAFASSLVGEFQGETTQFTPGISGIDANGAAIASRAGVTQKADKSSGGIVDPFDIVNVGLFGRAVALHRMNKPELARIVTDKVLDKGMPRETAWAAVLDAGLRQSFRKAAWTHLCARAPRWSRSLDYGLYGFWGGLMASSIASGHMTFIPEIWASLQALSTGAGAAVNKWHTGSSHLNERRWSVFYSNQQSDRYLALCAMSGLSRLIGVRK